MRPQYIIKSVLGGRRRFKISACVRLIIILDSRARSRSDAAWPLHFSLLLASGSFPRIIIDDVLDLNFARDPFRESGERGYKVREGTTEREGGKARVD